MRTPVIALVSTFLICAALTVLATEEYAARTNKGCEYCHADPAGGGRLTAEGEAFARQLQGGETRATLGGGMRVLRLAAGFTHIVFGFLWLGTILYVHLILKPAYAAGGLPKSELTLGWVSIVVMGVTGAILTGLRIGSPATLFATRFGILLSIKIAAYLCMVATATVATFVIGPRLKGKGQTATCAEAAGGGLASFDGRDGRPAFIGYGGKIYDVSNSPLWKDGAHMVRHRAGLDLTDALKQAPHGEEKVLAMPVVSELSAGPAKRPPHVVAFYLFAYWSLVNVGVVLAVLALWRWW